MDNTKKSHKGKGDPVTNNGIQGLQYKQTQLSAVAPATGKTRLQEWAAEQGMVIPQDILRSLGQDTADTTVRALQNAINRLRKATTKVTKLAVEKDTLSQRWQVFQKDLQDQFMKERAKYAEDMHANEMQLQQALADQRMLRSQIEKLSSQTGGPAELGQQGQLEPDLPSWLTSGPLETMEVDDWLSTAGDVRDVSLGNVKMEELMPMVSPEKPVKASNMALTPPPGRLSPVNGAAGPCTPNVRTGPPHTPVKPALRTALQPFGRPNVPTVECGGPPLDTTRATQYRSTADLMTYASTLGAPQIDPYMPSPSSLMAAQGARELATPPSGRARKQQTRTAIKEGSKPHGPVLATAAAERQTLADKLHAKRLQEQGAGQQKAGNLKAADCIPIDDDEALLLSELAPVPPSGSELEEMDA